MPVRRVLFKAILSYAVCSVLLAVVLAEIAFRPGRVPVEKGPAPVFGEGAQLYDVAVNCPDGVRLQGWYVVPRQTNGDSIILVHGVGDNRRGMLGYATGLVGKGYAVLMPDSRGHGASGGSPTYGIREADDIALWYEWLRLHKSRACVFGLGESMGAAILLQVAKRVPFCAIVAESPFASFREIAYTRVGQFFGTGCWLGGFVLRPSIELAFLYGRLTRGVWLSNASPQDAVEGTQLPILLIHGEADTNVPLWQSETILARNRSAIYLWKVPDAGHCAAKSTATQEFDERVLDWFASHRAVSQ